MDRIGSELGDTVGNRCGCAAGDDDARAGPAVGVDSKLVHMVDGETEGVVSGQVGVDGEGGVAAGLVFDRGVEPDEQRPLDATAGVGDGLGQPGGAVGRTHPLLPGVGVIQPDNGHRRCYRLAAKTVFASGIYIQVNCRNNAQIT